MIVKGSVRLRALEPNDVETLYKWENDMSLWQVSNTLTPFSKVQIHKYIQHSSLDIYQTKQLRLMVEAVTEDGAVNSVGMIDLFEFDPYHQRAGVGIMVHSSYQGHGIAKEALLLFVDYCFGRLGLHQLYCSIGIENTASIALFESSGFEKIGIKKDWRKTLSGYKDEALYQLIRRS
jgi:diamine N-acetyltransferase